jgi:lysophospholipase L1-like esterase
MRNPDFVLVSLLSLSFACGGLVACGTNGSDSAGAPDGGGAGGGTGGTGSGSGGAPGGGTGGSPSGGGAGTTGAGGSGGVTTPGRDGGAGTDGGGAPGAGGSTAVDGGRGGATATGGSTGAGGAGGAAGAGGSGALPALTIWIAGDSTVATGTAPCPIGWGGQFKPHFANQVTITNSAVAGRSVRTWLYNVLTTMDSTGECDLAPGPNGQPAVQAHWQAMLDGMKAGDYLFIQFGINDSDPTCPRHVGANAFKGSYGVMAQAAKDRGAHPVFITPVSSISCNGTTAQGSRGTYATATKQAGTQFGVPVIDLETLSVALYNSMHFCPVPGGDVSAATTGPVGDFFCDDHTHFSATGAPQIADLVAQAIRDQALPLAAYLK